MVKTRLKKVSNQNNNTGYAVILLAAGKSARLGRPKQLLFLNGITLLQHSLQTIKKTGIPTIITVLGAHANLLVDELKAFDIQPVININWADGMASSIRCGLEQLLKATPQTKAAIIMVCDQPFATESLLLDLIAQYETTGKPIIASSYANSLGTPALFDKTIFATLMELKGDTGAKKLFIENPELVGHVNFPLGKVDVDTEEDYQKLVQASNR